MFLMVSLAACQKKAIFSNQVSRLRIALGGATILLAVFGALADYTENFLRLDGFAQTEVPVAVATMWKWGLLESRGRNDACTRSLGCGHASL